MSKWFNFELEYLEYHYVDGDPVQSIGEVLGRSTKSILSKATYLNLFREYKPFKQPYDEDFFNKNAWTKELAYTVGIVITDGHVSKFPKKFIDIEMCDKDVLEKIARSINYTGNILEKSDGNIKHNNSYYVRLSGKKVWDFFTDLGLNNRKSYTCILPNIPHKFMKSFLRGVCDGDGSINIDKCGNPRVEISGTKQFIEGIIAVVPIKGSFYSKLGGNTYCIKYSSKNALSFLHLIYEDSNESIRMSRKYSKYLDVLDIALQKGWG